MSKSANLYIRIEPEVKEQAESILSTLGIPASSAVNMFYKQIILRNGLPFDVKIPEKPVGIAEMTAEQLDSKLEQGYSDMKNGRVISAEEVFLSIRKNI